MKLKLFQIIILSGLCYASLIQAQDNNIIKDSGFEQSTTGELKNWTGFFWAINGTYPGKAEIMLNKEKARNGAKYLKMDFEKSPGIKNDFMTVFDTCQYPVYKNKKYTMKVWCRGKGEIGIGFQRYDKGRKWIAWKPGQSKGFSKIDNETEWQEFFWSYIPNEEDNSLVCNISAKGKIDVDDVSLEITDCTEEEVAQIAKYNTVKPVIPAKKISGKTTEPSSNAADILNGNFEKWVPLANIPDGWKFVSKTLPEGWITENRPDEKGEITRIVNNSEDVGGEFGKSSVLLSGRIVSSHIYQNVNNKKIRLSLMAKGEGGSVIVRLREYTGTANNMVVNHVMEIISTDASGDWKKHTSEAVVSSHGGPPILGASIEIIGRNVLIDCVKVDILDLTKEFTRINYDIPVASNKIDIDGAFSEKEWSDSSGTSSGFVNSSGNLVGRPSDFRLSSDERNLLICIKTRFDGSLKKQILKNDGNVWEDDSYEIHINPTPGKKKPPVAYQFIINAAGTVFDQRMIDGVQLPANKDWNCSGLKIASKFVNNTWILELSIPLNEIGLEPGKEFGFNICRNLLNPVEASSLTGAGYFDYDKMVSCRISKNSPAIFWMATMGDTLKLVASAANNKSQKQDCGVTFSANTENFVKEEKLPLQLTPNSRESVTFTSEKQPGNFGEFGICITQDTDKTPFVTHTVRFEKTAALKQKQNDDEIAFYPAQKKIAVVFKDAKEKFAQCKPARINISIFKNDVLLEKIAMDKIEVDNDKEFAMANFPPKEEGKYLVMADVFDKDDNCIKHISTYIDVKNFPWINNNIGKGKEVLKPFTPLTKNGNEISCWGRKYLFAGSGLPEQIISQDEKVLTAPITFIFEEKGKTIQGKSGNLKFNECTEQSASFTGETLFPGFKVITTGRIEYDGTVFYDFDITGEKELSISSLQFEVPFKSLKYFHAPVGVGEALWISSLPEKGEYVDSTVPTWTPDYLYIPKGARKHNSLYFPEGNGLIWSSKNVTSAKIQGDFLTYLTFGNTMYGFSWFANNDRGWLCDPQKPSYEIIRDGVTSKIRINLITKPLELKSPRRISFALAATPVRPQKTGLNYFDYIVQGFGESSFTDRYGGGLEIKDAYLYDKYISRNKKSLFFYVCKSYFPLGDPVGQYFYNEWHTIPEESYNARNSMPSKKYGLNPDDYFAPSGCLYSERVDYMTYEIDKLAKNNPRLSGLYWDENYSVACLDISHEKCGYIREDGKIQAGFHLNTMRELDKRVESIFQKYERPFPNLLVHSTAMIPPLYSFADINLGGERGTKGLDFIDYWDLPRLENTGAGAWGINIMWIPQWGSAHGGSENSLKNNRSMLAALKLFDFNIWQIWCMPQFLQKFRDAEIKFGIDAEDSKFFGYWQPENKKAISGIPNYIKSSFFVRPDKGVLLYISNLNKEKQETSVNFDFSTWNIKKFKVTDIETGKAIEQSKNTVNLDIEGHDFRALLIEKVD